MVLSFSENKAQSGKAVSRENTDGDVSGKRALAKEKILDMKEDNWRGFYNM